MTTMSLDQSIEHGKDRRRPYYGSGRHDPTCRPHGGCPRCLRGRRHGTLLREMDAREQILEALEGMDAQETREVQVSP